MPHRANRTFVSNSDALTAWTPLARKALLDTARTYHATVDTAVLADAVQTRSGIAADQPADTWIGKLLDRVAADAKKRGEPPLAALCPQAADSAAHAAARLECYRAYADDLPADGGQPGRIFHVAPPRTRAASTRTAGTRTAGERRPTTPTNQLREVTCTSCWMIVPARDVCTSCGAELPAS